MKGVAAHPLKTRTNLLYSDETRTGLRIGVEVFGSRIKHPEVIRKLVSIFQAQVYAIKSYPDYRALDA